MKYCAAPLPSKQLTIPTLFLFLLTTPIFLGCQTGLDLKALSTYITQQDTLEEFSDKPYSTLWRRSQQALEDMGYVEEANPELGIIRGAIHQSSIEIRLKEMKPTAITRLRIKSRHMARTLPHYAMAQEVFLKISELIAN